MDISNGFKAGELVILSRPNIGQEKWIGKGAKGTVIRDSENEYTKVRFVTKDEHSVNFECYTHRLDLANFSLINE